MKEKSLIQGEPWKLILAFAVPVLLGQLLQQLYNTVDTIIVGQYAGEAALAAVGTSHSLVMFFLSLANGFSAGAGVIIAQQFGRGAYDEMRRTAAGSIGLMLFMGLAATVAAILAARPVLGGLMAASESFLAMAVMYFRIYALGLLFQFGYNIVAAVLRAVGDSKATLYFLLIASGANILLDLLFVAALNMSVAGAALATGIAQLGSMAAAFFYMFRKYEIFRFKRTDLHFDPAVWKSVLTVGFPMALQQMIVSMGFFLLQRAVNEFGQAMTASFTVGQRLEVYMLMPASSLQITMATYTGQNIGAGRMDRIRTGIRQTIGISFLGTAVLSLLAFVFSDPLIRLFSISEDAFFYCHQHLRFTAVAMLLFSLYFPVLGLFQGAGDAMAATLVATTALTMRVLSTYTLRNVPAFGYRIIWMNIMFGFTFAFLVTWIHYFRGSWKHKKRL
ncbi:MAG: MATE family efflux transporter [Firmicutes bacterium]|nr:MATE family efflux transporter [Bacillota bacterium]